MLNQSSSSFSHHMTLFSLPTSLWTGKGFPVCAHNGAHVLPGYKPTSSVLTVTPAILCRCVETNCIQRARTSTNECYCYVKYVRKEDWSSTSYNYAFVEQQSLFRTKCVQRISSRYKLPVSQVKFQHAPYHGQTFTPGFNSEAKGLTMICTIVLLLDISRSGEFVPHRLSLLH